MDDPPASPVPLSLHAASLAKSFALIPPAAAPAVVDCVLASSAVPAADLFHSLLLELPDHNEPLRSNQILSHTAALCHLVKSDWASLEARRALIWRVFVPVLRAIGPNDSEFLVQVEELLCGLLSDAQSREILAATIVPFCLRSIGRSMGMLQNEESAVYKWGAEDSLGERFSGAASGALQLSIACRVLTSLLHAALRSESSSSSLEQEFAQTLVWDLSSLALGILMHSLELRSCAVQLLLPHVFGSLSGLPSVKVLVKGSLCTLTRICFLRKIWKCCLSLFSLGSLERLDAYSVLSLYYSSFDGVTGSTNELIDTSSEEFDIGDEKEFWEEIRRGLVDKDASVRKQSLYILKKSLRRQFSSCGSESSQAFSDVSEFSIDGENIQTISPDRTACSGMTKRGKWAEKEAKSLGVGEVCHFGDRCLTEQGRWKVFVLLYEMLEEYGTHLVEAAWTNQVSMLFQSGPVNNYLDPFTCGVYRIQMGSLEGIFSWLAILWERGLFHENPQVRCLIMQSFLGIAWDKHQTYTNVVPRSFILGPFILGLNDVVHHRDFGVKGSYTSKTIQGAMKFLCKLSCQLSFSERVMLVCGLASVARQGSFGRAGLMALACCIASAACQSDSSTGTEVHDSSGGGRLDVKVQSNQENGLANASANLLDVLGLVIERSKQHFNPNYRLQVCEQVLRAASSTISVCGISLDGLLHFLSTIPRDFTDFGGPLRHIVQQWLSEINSQYNCINLVDTKTHFLSNLANFPGRFIKHHSSPKAFFSFDDEDVDAWGVEARRWARVLFLVITEEQHLEPIFMFLKNHCRIICKEDIDWAPIKLLILILSLVEEFEIILRTTDRMRRSFDMTNISEDQSAALTSLFCESFIRQLLLTSEDLLSFAKSVSPVFWSISMVKDTHLPSSIKGKLGGPTQRRLAPHTTSVVLHAIIAVRSISSISSWCTLLKSDNDLDSLYTFLWDFAWKVIQSPLCNSETGAELHLAAYEALVCVFKALSTAFTPMLIAIVLNHDKTSYLIEEAKPFLDSLLLNFLKSINHLLDDGVLTRSRRAILLTWKWLCLDSLLSIPYNIMEKEIHLRGCSFFSDSALRNTFIDIVESLENAGEDSVLAMLRSVRSLLGLLYSCTMRAIVTQSPGVDQQIILHLVHSSWILHLSCNKRRVAPIASLLSAVLHQSVFNNICMHETNGSKQGPYKWFIEKLLDEGEKSPRTIRLAALHLTGLWLLFPKTVKYYIKELMQLSLYGSVAFDEDFEAEVCENPEAKIEVSFLAQSPDHELTEVFINTEMYARVSVAVLFYKLANLANTRCGQENEDSLASLHCGKIFLLELLDSAVKDKDLSKELYKKYSGVHRRKVRVWQMLCILSRFVDEDIVNEVTSKLHICLYRNNLPAVRQYLETFAIQIYLKFPALAEEQLVPVFYDYNMRPQAVSSYVFIATNVIIHAKEQAVQTRHLNELLPPIIPFLTSHHHSLRGFTQLLVHYVLHRVWPTLKSNCSEVETFEKKCFQDLKAYLEENVDCVRLRASMEGFLDAFDPITAATPYGVFNARNEASDFECVPLSLMEQVTDFLNEVREVLRSSIAKDAVAIKNESLSVPSASKSNEESLLVNGERAFSQALKDFSMDFQKKITLSAQEGQRTDSHIPCILPPSSEFPKLLLDMEKEDLLLTPVLQSRNHVMEIIRRSQQEFILVASLLDRIPNLAGLARTCEVFKAAGLAVADATVVQDKQFQLISVTAEKWVPIIEVPVGSMKIFLEKKRREGFSIVGLEQTAKSMPLDQYSFSNKTVLVLGREKEGIPVDIIHVLDACVEIPQLGIIRSLNVHVSGAIALWEYTRQKRFRNH